MPGPPLAAARRQTTASAHGQHWSTGGGTPSSPPSSQTGRRRVRRRLQRRAGRWRATARPPAVGCTSRSRARRTRSRSTPLTPRISRATLAATRSWLPSAARTWCERVCTTITTGRYTVRYKTYVSGVRRLLSLHGVALVAQGARRDARSQTVSCQGRGLAQGGRTRRRV